MRLFVGIELPPVITDHLALVGGGIPRARWEDRSKLHVTVRFIGEVDGGTKRRIEDALQAVRCAPFSLAATGVGFFPPGGKPRILWAGVEPVAPLRELHERVERALVHAGLAPEGRKYTPHITLARLRDPPRHKVIEFLQHQALLRTSEVEVEAFQLYSSVLSPGGSKYRIEHHYPLEGLPGA
ncbi:RNA 2',3'-cyclic phosphodiesterase [Paraliomyxa miuraensis]|uniref:RNA 2',3'-cyclic phosphodiesterase n=1 Tax=Paraliomyxa miuraensis TaxID=376150 RepID=UPI002253AAD4|nr:RNA 2',3'-cyclic phosphodiesterase [Paraliomyxa miuraensis]MCX4245494.1 RNA 2',3'-cyclic phosphodiesterase [Paraliomyxa miuraensis]